MDGECLMARALDVLEAGPGGGVGGGAEGDPQAVAVPGLGGLQGAAGQQHRSQYPRGGIPTCRCSRFLI